MTATKATMLPDRPVDGPAKSDSGLEGKRKVVGAGVGAGLGTELPVGVGAMDDWVGAGVGDVGAEVAAGLGAEVGAGVGTAVGAQTGPEPMKPSSAE